MSDGDGGIAPALDLDSFRRRGHAIAKAREQACQDAKDHGLLEADADFHYRIEKSKRLLALRDAGKGAAEAIALAEGDSVVAEHKRTRDREAVLKRAAQENIAMLERNAASLRKEADMSGDI